MLSQQSSTEPQAPLHVQIASDHCPWCDQLIPHDRFEDIRSRIESEERSRAAEAEQRLRATFATEKAQADLKARAELVQVKKEAEALARRSAGDAQTREVAAREEGRRVAAAAASEAAVAERIRVQHEKQILEDKLQEAAVATATLERERRESVARMAELMEAATAREAAAHAEGKLAAEVAASESAAAERATARRERDALEAKLRAADEMASAFERERTESAARLAELADGAAARECAAREQGRLAAETAAGEAAVAERLRQERERQALEDRLKAADDARATLERERNESATRLAELVDGAATRELAAREEGKLAAESAAASLLGAARDAQRMAEGEAEGLRIGKEAELQVRLAEQREALEKDKTDAVNTERSQAFNDKLKLEGKLEEVQRQLQSKTAGDLGEGAEVDLFEMLKAEFPDDRIKRVPKGVSGADLIHEVLHHGKICGSIIYDSKNCSAWREDYAKKLRQDQLAAKADHAVLALATAGFPSGARQLHVRGGVILTNPARAAVVAQILRKQLVQVHSLRLSSEARDEKTAELYAFITSDRCTQLLDRMSTATGALEDIEVKEVKAHQATWKKRGEVIRLVQKHHADFTLEIERIIGTAEGERAR